MRTIRPDHNVAAIAAQELPGCRRGEANREAKIWTLIDPSGNRIEVTNLLQWCKENANRFGMKPEQAGNIACGFRGIAASMRGKTPRKVGSYKGWHLDGLPRLQNVDPQMRSLTYDAFKRLWLLAVRTPNPDDYIWQVGAMPNTDAARSLTLIHSVANGNVSALRAYTSLTQSEFADRYGIRLVNLRRWELHPETTQLVMMQLLTYTILMDERNTANPSSETPT